MGFDMHWRRRTDDGNGGHFRLGVWGMANYRQLMASFEMAFIDAPPGRFPTLNAYGLTRDDLLRARNAAGQSGGDCDEATRGKVQVFHADLENHLSRHAEDTPGVPLHKLCSNAGWIVLPTECKQALDAWHECCRRYGEIFAYAHIAEAGKDPDRWRQWLQYLEGAIDHDGFTVN